MDVLDVVDACSLIILRTALLSSALRTVQTLRARLFSPRRLRQKRSRWVLAGTFASTNPAKAQFSEVSQLSLPCDWKPAAIVRQMAFEQSETAPLHSREAQFDETSTRVSQKAKR